MIGGRLSHWGAHNFYFATFYCECNLPLTPGLSKGILRCPLTLKVDLKKNMGWSGQGRLLGALPLLLLLVVVLPLSCAAEKPTGDRDSGVDVGTDAEEDPASHPVGQMSASSGDMGAFVRWRRFSAATTV